MTGVIIFAALGFICFIGAVVIYLRAENNDFKIFNDKVAGLSTAQQRIEELDKKTADLKALADKLSGIANQMAEVQAKPLQSPEHQKVMVEFKPLHVKIDKDVAIYRPGDKKERPKPNATLLEKSGVSKHKPSGH